MTNPIYAVGDIHGQKSELDRVLDLIERDGGSAAQVVFLGDYTDRGPDSRAVIETLIEGQAAGRDWVCVKGNHDRMFEWFLEDPPRHDPYMAVELHWLHERLGGDTTLASYGVDAAGKRQEKKVHADAREAVPQAHIDFLKSLNLTHQVNGLLFVHAGIRPGIALDQQTEEDLLWIRSDFHVHTAPHPFLVVHGHTPIRQATDYGNRVNLDTAAGYGEPLTVAVFEDDQVWRLSKDGRLPLRSV